MSHSFLILLMSVIKLMFCKGLVTDACILEMVDAQMKVSGQKEGWQYLMSFKNIYARRD